MANNSKQCFNTHYQSHCHPTTKSLWLCSSVYCRPPHQSRRIWLVAAATNQKDARMCENYIMANDVFKILWPEENGRHFADDIFKCILFNESFNILINSFIIQISIIIFFWELSMMNRQELEMDCRRIIDKTQYGQINQRLNFRLLDIAV